MSVSMKYIIMCGGTYHDWSVPRQFTKIKGEPIIARTIRLLKENGIKDIAITTNLNGFEEYAPVIRTDNNYVAERGAIIGGRWNECFYLTDSPACYIFGDVYFSPEAIRKIVEYETKGAMFFASAPPFDKRYIKPWAEPFALKVENMEILRRAINETNRFEEQGKFKRKPIMWELWQVITNHKLNDIDYNSYVHINDYTCDIDNVYDAVRLQEVL